MSTCGQSAGSRELAGAEAGDSRSPSDFQVCLPILNQQKSSLSLNDACKELLLLHCRVHLSGPEHAVLVLSFSKFGNRQSE